MAFLYQINPLIYSGRESVLNELHWSLVPRWVGEKDGNNDSDDSGDCDAAEVGAVSLYSPHHARQGPFTEQSSAAF